MAVINTLSITPALLNTSCAWASDFEQLQALYRSPFTGAVTTRTATKDGFHEDASHTVVFTTSTSSSLNSYGYSPNPLSTYLAWVETILSSTDSDKPFIISIAAGTDEELLAMLSAVQRLRQKLGDVHSTPSSRIGLEFNTSCPNIPGSPPKGYILHTDPMMQRFLSILAESVKQDPTLTIGLKLPPYLYKQQFLDVLNAVKPFHFLGPDGANRNVFSFFTCTNTLGNSLLFLDQVSTTSSSSSESALPTALGGLAGDGLHALALGNVYTFSGLLEESDEATRKIQIIGVGGVTNKSAMLRMLKAGATLVGLATMLGKVGVDIFEQLSVD